MAYLAPAFYSALDNSFMIRVRPKVRPWNFDKRFGESVQIDCKLHYLMQYQLLKSKHIDNHAVTSLIDSLNAKCWRLRKLSQNLPNFDMVQNNMLFLAPCVMFLTMRAPDRPKPPQKPKPGRRHNSGRYRNQRPVPSHRPSASPPSVARWQNLIPSFP